MTGGEAKNNTDFSLLCVDECGGRCCDPWWGIIFYKLDVPLTKVSGDGLTLLIASSIAKRVKRISSTYVTKEKPARALFGEPERYNVNAEGVEVLEGGTARVSIRAMFAFRCLFLSSSNRCTIHPSEHGRDLRPPHCAELGSPGARRGEKGYCRIIEAAIKSPGSSEATQRAIELEKKTSESHYGEGKNTLDEAASHVAAQVKRELKGAIARTSNLDAGKKTGRNDPCPCGSGKKFKKCHGR